MSGSNGRICQMVMNSTPFSRKFNMRVDSIRPDVTSLILQVSQKAPHPELLKSVEKDVFRTHDVTAEVALTPMGHAVIWKRQSSVLCELIAEQSLASTATRSCLLQKIRGCKTHIVRPATGNWEYSVSSQLELLEPDQFLGAHEDLLSDLHRATISHVFPTRNRLSPAPLSLLMLEVTGHAISVHSFHSFPAHCGIVRTQSLLELNPMPGFSS